MNDTKPITAAAHNASQIGFSEFKRPIWQSEAIQAAVKKLVSSRNLAIENLTEKQVGDAIAQAIASGDFIRHVRVSDDAQSVTYIPYSETERYRALYYELLMAVGMKYEGETRHETALRYIKNAENFPIREPQQCKESILAAAANKA